jgi:hypothetical protein
VGGRDAHQVFADVWVLSTRVSDSPGGLAWREVEANKSPPPAVFHHATTLFPTAGDVAEQLLIVGGLRTPDDVLELENAPPSDSTALLLSITADGASFSSSPADRLFPNAHVPAAHAGGGRRTFASLLLSPCLASADGGGAESNRRAVALAGGVRVAKGEGGEQVLDLYEATTRGGLARREVAVKDGGAPVDVGAMVHAAGLMLCPEGDEGRVELLLLGGGAPEFAFRPSYERESHARASATTPPTSTQPPPPPSLQVLALLLRNRAPQKQ